MKFLVSLLAYRPGKIGGAETVVLELMRALSEIVPAKGMKLLCTSENAPRFQSLNIEQVICHLPDPQLVRWRIVEALTPIHCKQLHGLFERRLYDFVWFPQQSIFPKLVNCRSVLTVYDFQHYRFPGNFSLPERVFRAAAYPRSIRQADHLIAISSQTRAEVLRYFPVDEDKVTAIPLGSNLVPNESREPTPDNGSFLLFPAATYIHKDHETLIRTVASLHSKGLWKWKVILTGQKTGRWPRLRQQIDRMNVQDIFQHEGFVSKERLDWLFANCLAVLFPSKYEGFGLPVVEAAARNKPILVSDLPIYDEIGVPQKCRLDFGEPSRLLEALQTINLRTAQLPTRTWRDCAVQHLELFEYLVTKWKKS